MKIIIPFLIFGLTACSAQSIGDKPSYIGVPENFDGHPVIICEKDDDCPEGTYHLIPHGNITDPVLIRGQLAYKVRT